MRRKGTSFVALVALLASGITALDIPASANAAIVTSNLVLNLDGNDTTSLATTSPTVWNSISPGSSTAAGTISGATRYTAVGTNGLSFTSTQSVTFGTGVGRTPGDMTFDTWIRPGNLVTGWNIIASRWFTAAGDGSAANSDWVLAIFVSGTTAKLHLETTSIRNAGLDGNTTFPITSANKWYHVGFTADSVAGKVQLFLNGQADSALTTGTHTDQPNSAFWLGEGRGATGNAGAAMVISKARLYNGALTAAQITQNFNADAAAYGISPVNVTVPSIIGKPRIGTTLTANTGSWTADDSATVAYKWQASQDGSSNWVDLPSAISSTYTVASGDAGIYLRSAVSKTTSAGTTTAYSVSTIRIPTTLYTVQASGSKVPNLTSTVPNDSSTYNVTLSTSNLGVGTFTLGTTTGLTLVSGYSSTASYMATTIGASASIISFRGTGTDINNALANVTYANSNTGNSDIIKLNYAYADSTATGPKNYIPIYDNGQLTFHYYTVQKFHAATKTRAEMDASLVGLTTQDGVAGSNWFVVTPRYKPEWDRVQAMMGSSADGIYMAADIALNSGDFYWSANTDGYSSSTRFATSTSGSATATSNVFNQINTSLPFHTGEPNGVPANGARVGFIYYVASDSTLGTVQGWDDVPISCSCTKSFIAETYSTSVLNAQKTDGSAGTNATIAQTIRTGTLAGAPTGVVASGPATSVTVSWTAPASTGTDPLIDYVLQYSTEGGAWTNWAHTESTATSATVTGLNASKVYSFRVAAYTSDYGPWSTPVIGTTATSPGSFKPLSGYVVPTNMTGTIRVLLSSSNSAGRLWVTDTSNIDGGLRGTANYPDNNSGWIPLNNYQPANINSAGQMIGLTDTSAADINTALASLRYQSPTASTDTINMWVSNGTEYVALMSGSTVEFHYYGKNTTSTGSWSTVRGNGYAGAAQTIDGVTIPAGTPYLATPRYRAENLYVMGLIGTNMVWLNASDDTAAPASSTEGSWKWFGPDANGVQFWSGSTTGASVNGEYVDWNQTTATGNPYSEPNGSTTENCNGTNGAGATLGPVAGYAWNDFACSSSYGYAWEVNGNGGAPYGSNTTNPAAANYTSLAVKQTVTVAAPPAAPTALTATSSASGQVDLSWTAPAGVTGITSYSVQYSTDGKTWTEDRGAASTATTESVTGLTTGTYYHFRVAALTVSATGLFTSTYYTPVGTGQKIVQYSTNQLLSGVSIDSSLNTYKVSVLLRTNSISGSYGNLSVTTTTNLGGIRGTANYSALTTAGQMIGLTGLGSDVNAALATLKYNGQATAGNNAVSMWISVGSTTTLPQAYVPVVNSVGQVEFHYFGYNSTTGTWALAQTRAQSDSSTINGQSVSGKYFATAESADQSATIGDVLNSAGVTSRVWLNGGDYTTVSSGNAEGAWYWLGPDTGTSQFWSGAGAGSAVNSSYYNWGAQNSTTRMEPNGGNTANCLMIDSSPTDYTYTYSGGAFTTLANAGRVAWDDGNCNDSNVGFVWEYIAAAPVGATTLGANYAGQSALSVVFKPAAEPVSGLTLTATGNSSIVANWTAATVNVGTFSQYKIEYSTSSTFASGVVTINGSTSISNTTQLITGLTASTTYYVRVSAVTSTGTGTTSSNSNVATGATATTINVVASGGGVAGTDYVNSNGIFYPKSGTTVSINAADIQSSLLTQGTTIAADTVNINGAISWATSQVLTLGNTTASTVAVNQNISASGVSSGLVIASSSYSLLTKSGYSIQLTGTSPTFTLGGTSYVVVNTVAGLANVAAGTTWALTAPITLTGTYTTAVKDITFAGIMDGLGNTISNMQINVTTTRNAGFYMSLGGATVRNVGFTNVNITSPTDNISTRLGAVAGDGSYSGSVTNTVSQVWATGFINQSGSTGANTEAGGLFGGATLGTLNISKSWSSVAISTAAAKVGSGGIIGTNVPSFGGNPAGSAATGNVLTISESYSTGNILRNLPATAGWYGNGGIIGVAYGWSTTITNAFAWGNINSSGTQAGVSTAGISGVGTATITNAYTTHASCGGSTITNCVGSVVPGAAPATGTGFGTGLWSTTNGASLVNLPLPTKLLYVQVFAPSNGAYVGMGYQIVDSTGTIQDAAKLTSINVTVTGTPTYTIASNVAKGTYSVAYTSGLTLGGTAASVYSLSAWITNTSVTISKLSQSVTWSPTTTYNFGTGTITPSAAPVASGGTTISYAVSSAGTTGCTVNSSTGVITYTSAGTCAITATAANAGDYLDASSTVSFVITAAPTFTVVATGGGVSGTDYVLANGVITASANASINASDLQTMLASGSVTLAGNVVVNSPITWSSNSVLTLGGTSTNTVAVNASITGSGNTAGIVIKPSSYSLSTKSGAAIALSGTTPTLSIGGNTYTLVKAISDLGTVATTGNYALAVPLTYSSTISAPPISGAFAGTFDGLGNTIDKLTIVSTANLGTGLFKNLSGGTIRNLGLTNEYISLEPTVTTNNLYAGGLVGDTAGGTLDQVWTTGFMRVKPGSTYAGLALGGLTGANYSGTLNITKSWSALNLYGWASTYTNFAAGGIIGGDFSSFTTTGTTAGGTVNMSQVYSLGDIANPTTTGATSGLGGIMGVHAGTGTVSIVDAFSWSQLSYNTGANAGGIISIANGGAVTITNYSSIQAVNNMTTGTSTFTKTNGTISAGFGSTIPALESLSNWYASGKGTSLVNLPTPYKNLYVRVIAPTDGSYGTMSYVLSNGVAATLTLSNYSLAVTGTPTYSIASNVTVSATPYNVDYVSGLTFTYSGGNPNVYRFGAYGFSTAVTISKYPQTVTWSPTTSVDFGSGTITPSALASASGSTAITYAVTDAGTTGCTVNATTAVITTTQSGTCTVTATAANSGNYLAASAAVSFVIAEASSAPTAVTATSSGTTSLFVSWTAPTVNASSALTGYQIIYSTSAAMTSPTTVNTGSTATAKLITGLTAGTTYYLQVRASNGTTWYGTYSAAISGAPSVTPTTVTIVSSGGGTLGTDYKISGGILSATGSVSVNVADLQGALLTGGVTIAADNIVINTDVTWNTSQVLTLGTSTANTVTINGDLTASGTTGGIVIAPTSYTLNVKNGAALILSGASTTLSIGGNSYTLIRSTAGLSSVTATGYFALATPITFSGNLTSSPVALDFAGTFDGLGNTADLMRIKPTASGTYGFFTRLNGATVRNFGLTRAWISMVNLSSASVNSGILAGEAYGTTSVSQVWTTGHNDAATGSYAALSLGGVIGNATGGTLTLSKTWSAVSLNSNSTTTSVVVGGILGSNQAVVGNGPGVAGGSVVMNEVYSTGDILWAASAYHRGYGGIMGLAYSTGTVSITDAFSWSYLTARDLNYGGIIGASAGGNATVTRAYTTFSSAGQSTTSTSVSAGITIGANVANLSTSAWTGSGTSKLVNLPDPKRPAHVVVNAPTNGAYSGITYSVVDGLWGTGTLANMGLTVSGTPTYSIASDVALGTYNVSYVSGLTLGGTNANYYSLGIWPNPTSVTISKLSQTISLTSTPPTTATVGSTYTLTGSASSSLTVSYSIDASTTSICSISGAVVTFNALGTCKVNADQAGNTTYLAAAQVQQSAIATVKGDQTVSFSSTAPSAKVSGATYTPTGSATSGLSPVITVDSGSSSICSIAAGVVSFAAVGNCVLNINQTGTANWNAATQQQQTVIVAKGDQTITFTSTAPSAAVVSGTSYTPTATSTSAGTVAFTIDAASASVCSIAAGVVTYQTVGTCKVLANQAGGTNWNAATQNFQTFSVGKGTPVITLTSTASSPKVNTTYTPTATSPSPVAIVFTIDSTTTSVCSIAAGVVSFLTVGTCKVNANQIADSNWNAAAQAPQTITVVKGDQTINVSTTATNAKVNTTYTPAGTSTSGGAVAFTIDSTTTSVCTISLGIVSYIAAGTCKVNANQAGGTNWNAAPPSQEIITVGKGEQSINISSTAPSAKVAGSTYTPVATATSGIAVAFTVDSSSTTYCSISGGVVSFLALGSCVLNANQAGNTNWNAAAQQQQTITVSKGISTIVITSTAPTTAVVGGSTYTLASTKTAANTNSVVYSVDSTTSTICSISGAVVSFLLVGTCRVNANLATDTQYEAATQQQQVITVNKGDQTLAFTSSAPNAAKVGAPTYTVTATGGASTSAIVLSVDSSATTKCSVSGMVVTYLAVGDCVLNLNQAGDTNYNAATPVQQTVTITSDGRCPNGVVSGNYCIIRFNASGTWTVPAGVTSVDMLAVGGGGAGAGGSGGNYSGGGGGGGEVLENLGAAVTPGQRFTATIGAGGIGGGAASANSGSTSGSATTLTASGFTTLTARGGGRGGGWNLDGSGTGGIGVEFPAGSGASVAGGGGAGSQTTNRSNSAGIGGVSTGGTGTPSNTDGNQQAAGGGGGALGNGGASTATTGGAGGAGKTSTILGTIVGGGGGGGKRTGTGGNGGSATAGGGAGGGGTAGVSGTANTGGGGGGSGGSNNGGNGGSGVVVIRIALQSQTVSFTSTAPTGLVFGTSTAYTPTVSGAATEASATITVDAASSSVCSITDGVFSVLGAGTCTLNANQAANGFYASATQVQQSFTIAKIGQTVSFTNDPASTKVNTTYTPTGTATGGGTVTFSIASSSSAVCTITAGVVSFNAVGSCVVQADSATTTNYNAAPQVTKTITVTKGDQTITFTNNPATPKVNTTYTPTATSTGGGTVTFTIDSSSSAVCSIASGVVTFNAVGDCLILGDSAATTNWNAATQGSKTVTVAKGDQTITFTNNPATPKVNTSYTPTATSTSGGTVTFTIAGASSAVCSISSGVVTFNAVGTCTILGDVDASANWNAATQGSKNVIVTKGDQAITFTSTAPTDAVVDGSTYTITATGGASTSAVAFTVDSSATAYCSISGAVVTFRAVGSCVINANQATDSNFLAAAQVQQTITVGKGAQVVAINSTAPTDAVVAGSNYTVTKTGGAGTAAVALSIDATATAVCSISGSVVSFLTAGTCKINANQAGDANYNAANQVQQSFNVGKGAQVVAITSTAPTTAVVDGSSYTVTKTGGAGTAAVILSIDSSATGVCSVTANVISFLTAGTCVVNANQAGDANYNAATQVQQSFTVGKGSQTVAITSTAPSSAVVAGSTYTVTATRGSGTANVILSIDATATAVCSISGSVVSFQTAGTCKVNANQAGDDNYNAATQVQQSFTVGKGSQTVALTSVAPTGVRVDDSVYVPTATGGASTSSVTISIASASSAICEINNGEVSFHAVGSCVVEVNQDGDANYNAAAQVTQTISVAKGLQTITKTSTDPAAVVDGSTYTPTFTSGASGSAVVVAIAAGSAADCTVSTGTISFIGAGDCDVTVNQAGNANYEAAPELAFTITVGKGSQAITWTTSEPSSAVVGGVTYNPAATGGATGNTVSFRVDVNTASVCAVSAGAVRFIGVGTCTVVANQSGNSNYLAAPQVSQTFTVGKGTQAIAFTSTIPNAVVDGSAYTPAALGGPTGNSVTFSIASASSAVCTLAYGKISFQNVGTCEVEANQLGNTNYLAASQVVQSFSVGKGAQTVSFTSAAPRAKVSGTTYTPVTAGGASGNAVTLSIAPASSSICSVNNGVVSYQAVGSCVVQANQAASANYEAAAQVTQTITVAKGVQVLNFTTTPPSLRPVQGTTYVPAVTFGNSGVPVVFTIGAEAASICTIANGTISFLAVGDCVLYADQAGNANYTAASRISQIFDITKGEQIVNITSTAPTTAVVDGSTYTPTGTGGAGTSPLVFTATAESEGICSVQVGVVYFQGAGDCVIALNQAGDTNYNAATQKLQTISVGKGSQTITFTSTNTTATVDGAAYVPTFTKGSSINAVHISVASSSSLVCEVTAGSVAFHSVGDCVIEATQAADNNYEAAPMVAQTISVAQGTQVALVGHASLSSLTLGSSTPTAVLTTSGGSGDGAISWSVDPTSAAYCSVSGDVVSGLASGYCDLVATKAADQNYLEATATLTVVVSTGGQAPVRTSINVENPTFSEGLTLTLSLDGGDGSGAVWFESLTTHVCNTDGGTTLNVYHAGTCNVIGHKDGDDNYEAVQDTLSFNIAKATQSGVTIHLASPLTYSATGAVTSALSLDGVLAGGAQSFSVTSGTCTVVDGELSATEAGDCEVTASIVGDDKYLDGTFTHTFTVAKAAQSPLTTTLATDALPAIAWNGVKTTTFDVAGGSGDGALTVNTSTPLICSVSLTDSVVTVTGIAQGTCDASISRAATANYLGASTLFNVEVLDLAGRPTAVAAAAPVRAPNGSLLSTVSWTAPAAASTRASVTGVKVQSRIGNGAWADVTETPVPASETSLAVAVQPWTKYNFRVAATTALDGDNLNWAYFDLSGDNTPDVLVVGGGRVVASTAKAATTSGETVIITGAGFEAGYTTRVELTTGSSVFAAGIRPAAALAQTVVLPATYISPTQLSFVLPKITLPKGTLSLTTQIKVLSTDNLKSDAFPLDYIPKKLTQTLTATLPAANTIMTMTAPLISTGTVTSSSSDNPPVVTATPASVCTASINVLNKLVVTPVSPGKCSISVVVPGTPAYLVSATKSTVVYIKTNRTAGLTATADSVTSAGAHTPTTFTVTSGLSNTSISVVVGENAVEVPVTLNKREGAVLFTVDAASDAAGRCIADGGDATTGLVGTITMNDLGTCKVTVTLPADDGYYVGTETIVITVNGVAADPTVPVVQDLGDGEASPEDTDLNPKDPDTEPAVAITLDPSRAADYSFGGEDGLAFDPLTKKLNVRSRTPLVGVWTATLTSPNVNKTWFKIPGKIVKKVQTYTYSNICKLTMTVKKDPKLKKKVTRIVGAGCILSSANEVKPGKEAGWTALTSVGIQKIKVKYKRIRQYAKTGLSYVKTKGNRVLKNINRTWVVKIGRRP